MPIYHSKSQPTDDKLSLKWAWSHHVIHFKCQGPKHTGYLRNNWCYNRQICYTGRLYL